jgi:hypothetical protein
VGQRALGFTVAAGQGREQIRCAPREGAHELALGDRADREVEQQGGSVEPGMGITGECALARELEDPGPVCEPGLQQRRLVGAADALQLRRLRDQRVLGDRGQPQLVDDTRQRAHEPRSAGRALEAPELAPLVHTLDDPRHQRLAHQRTDGNRRVSRQANGCELGRTTGQGGAVPAESRPAFEHGVAQQLVRRVGGRGDHEHFLSLGSREQPLARLRDPDARSGRGDRPGRHGSMLHADSRGIPMVGCHCPAESAKLRSSSSVDDASRTLVG